MKYSISFLLILTAAVGLCFGIYVWGQDQVEFAECGSSTKNSSINELGFSGIEGIELDQHQRQELVEISGNLSKDTAIVCTMYRVESGVGQMQNSFHIGQCVEVPGIPWRTPTTVQLTLETKSTVLSSASLGWRGCTEPMEHKVLGTTRHSIGEPFLDNDFAWTFEESYRGKLNQGGTVIAYVVGDTEFKLEPFQGVESFAKENDGKFWVITVGLQRGSNE